MFLIGVTWQASFTSIIANESNKIDSISQLLEELYERMVNEGMLVALTLHTPIFRDEQRILIGYSEPLGVRAIGRDHLCLREIQGGAEIITCIPFSNIAGIDYINN
jgi:hypothetical protein